MRDIGIVLGSSEARRRRRRVERRLRAESPSAHRRPPADLFRRTLAALNDATLETPAARPRSAGSAYAVAVLVFVTLGAVAVRFNVPAGRGDEVALDAGPSLASLDTASVDALVRLRLGKLESTWELPLRNEATLLVADVRRAGQSVLANLPLPAEWR